VLLHEMVHAVHFQLFGSQNQLIRNAYSQAIDRGLYDQAKDVNGRTVRPYARASEAEYFAEISCAYLNKLHYFPFNREDLYEHDPVGYRLMVLTWGPPGRLNAAIQIDSEKVAGQRLLRARLLSQTGKKQEARTALQDLIETYPATRAAGEARELLGKIADPTTAPSEQSKSPH
jgi:hypothetical protein